VPQSAVPVSAMVDMTDKTLRERVARIEARMGDLVANQQALATTLTHSIDGMSNRMMDALHELKVELESFAIWKSQVDHRHAIENGIVKAKEADEQRRANQVRMLRERLGIGSAAVGILSGLLVLLWQLGVI
jgi:hypothetical protein